MSPSFEKVQQLLKQLPGLGYRSAERIALHLLVEKPERLAPLLESLRTAAEQLRRCPVTGNLTEGDLCAIYADPSRRRELVCVVETVPDLLAIERSGAYRGVYHVLHGRLSPLQGIGPDSLNTEGLLRRLRSGEIEEIILALPNDIESEATCHYIQDELLAPFASVRLCRIGFGLPSGGGLTFADPATLRSALDARRLFHQD